MRGAEEKKSREGCEKKINLRQSCLRIARCWTNQPPSSSCQMAAISGSRARMRAGMARWWALGRSRGALGPTGRAKLFGWSFVSAGGGTYTNKGSTSTRARSRACFDWGYRSSCRLEKNLQSIVCACCVDVIMDRVSSHSGSNGSRTSRVGHSPSDIEHVFAS